jgi:nicotinamidase-related amidase
MPVVMQQILLPVIHWYSMVATGRDWRMNGSTDSNHHLIDVTDSILVVIDIQDYFLNKYNPNVSQDVVAKAAWVIRVAQYFQVPIIAMAEDIASSGNLNDKITRALPIGTTIHDKQYFGLAGNSEILDAVDNCGRKTTILIGLETDVCVAQSALGLLQHDYRVVVVHDATATTAGDQEAGLSRMREAGVVICSAKSLYYEWQRCVANCRVTRETATDLLSKQRPDCLEL